ncbi:electron transfer flavoprotein subunit beta/FixA family protein [Alicyclobacillus macrosporangiidus]|jgi:electron transfer flavoprotein beta subunit|uniref:Electron transfer flavoprotein small subunit n=1 Tax=Alicyclobacillus macrosporangiidus TaxID=392015 RepID=A0A1I7HV00_9BACL|nr:electron transfer flavoprotein subunit beta/FixA family protein [Alicyclobacillus macrosporangiidus]SFU64399.1 electron transfer flavoprotein beta subunit [Alicyclobacillus macrosporangiidus]
MLHLVVCIKQVPDSREIRIDPKTNTLIRQGVPAIVNYYDLHGLEEALRIKDRHGARVTVVTMGPPSADKALKQCIAMGADEGVLVSDRAFAGADTLATSYVVAMTIRKAEEEWGPVDIVFCGKQTLDGDTGQVGPGVACRLDLEQLTYVEKVEHLDLERREIIVHRHLEDGVERVRAKLPVLITALAELNEPRRASLPGVLRAARYKPMVWTTNDFPDLDRSKIGLRGSPTIVAKTWVPEPRKVNTEYIPADPPEAAAEALVERLFASDIAEKLGWVQGVRA